MATIVKTQPERKLAERRFYSRMALLLAVVMLLGFGPSFYLRGIVPPYPRPNPSLSPFVLLHGTIFTLWMLAIIAQTQLIRTNQHKVHMSFGIATVVLGLLMIPIMYMTAVWQVERANQPPFTDPLTWTIVPLAGIIPFAVMLWNGWSRRRDSQWHKRAMLGAAILVVAGPSIGRLPIAPPTVIGFTIIFLLEFLLFVPLILWDRKTLGHVHPATRLGLAMMAISVFLPIIVFWTGADWASITRHLPGVNPA